MKGIVLNLLEETIRRHHSEAVWEAALDAAHLDGAYTSLGNYSDDEFHALVAAASRLTNREPEEFVRWFGAEAIEPLAARYPRLFAQPSMRAFLLTLNSMIHPEVRKLYPGSDVPHFDYLPSASNTLLMRYVSKRRLCGFAEGLIAGAAKYFRERASIAQQQCVLRGDAGCLFVVTFAGELHG